MKVQETINNLDLLSRQHVFTNNKLLRNNRVISISNIDLDPKGKGKGYVKCQAVSVEYLDDTWAKMGYISDFRGSGEEAIMIHGTKNGGITLTSNNPKFVFTVKGFINYVKQRHGIDLSAEKSKPLHVISCFGVSNGVYQGFSNALQRTVNGYGDGSAIAAKVELKYHLSKETSVIKSVKSSVANGQLKKSILGNASVTVFKPNAK